MEGRSKKAERGPETNPPQCWSAGEERKVEREIPGAAARKFRRDFNISFSRRRRHAREKRKEGRDRRALARFDIALALQPPPPPLTSYTLT